VEQAFLRFWEGERDREKLIHGIEAARDRALVNYVYDTHFAPLINRKAGGLEEQAEAFYTEHIVVLKRIVQLTSDKTFDNGHRFSKALFLATPYRKHISALTFENFVFLSGACDSVLGGYTAKGRLPYKNSCPRLKEQGIISLQRSPRYGTTSGTRRLCLGAWIRRASC
jgi:hypothetical protein